MKEKLKTLADQLFSKKIRARGVCARCGTTRHDFDCSHIITRGNTGLRWCEANALCLCRECHRWAHDNPKSFTAWVRNKYPKAYEYLESERYKVTKCTEVYILEVIDRLREEKKIIN